jgi:hypothetical protein
LCFSFRGVLHPVLSSKKTSRSQFIGRIWVDVCLTVFCAIIISCIKNSNSAWETSWEWKRFWVWYVGCLATRVTRLGKFSPIG